MVFDIGVANLEESGSMNSWWWLGGGVLGLGLILIFKPVDDRVKVVICDVGQGEAVLVTSGGFQLLIDTGPPTNGVLRCLGNNLAWTDKLIEAVVISHADADHSGGLAGIMDHYRIGNLYSATRLEGVNEQISYTYNLRQNDHIRYEKIDYEILSPAILEGNTNIDSVVGMISYEDKKMLVMGDVPAEIEQRLVWRDILNRDKGTLLVVSHHGSGEATSEELLETIRPEEAIISVGKNNKFGHPAKVVLERLESRGIRVRRTDQEGDIIYRW